MSKIYDIIIVGGGPAGLTAAVYALRDGKDIMIIEKSVFGGQIVNSPKVENIPGFASISGEDFGDLMLKQVTDLGGEVNFDTVESVETDGKTATVHTELQGDFYAKTVILATGTTHRRLNLEGEEDLIGKGVHFCAVCDGAFYKDKEVVMVGGGNSAFVEGLQLAGLVKKMTLLQDLPVFTAEKKLQEDMATRSNVEMHISTKVLGYITENGKLTGVRYSENGEEKVVPCDGVFLAVGLVPENGAFKDVAELDERGYFNADETGITKNGNIFVAGDCRRKGLRQVATACSDGANAMISAANWIRKNY